MLTSSQFQRNQYEVAILGVVVTSQLIEQVEVSVPQSLAEAIRTKAGAYAAHFRKLQGKEHITI